MFGGLQNAYDFGPDQANVLAAFMVAAPDYSPNAEGRADRKELLINSFGRTFSNARPKNS